MDINKLEKLIDKMPLNKKLEISKYINNSYSIFDEYSKIEKCPYCNSTYIVKNGTRKGINRYICRDCKKSFTYKTNTPIHYIHKINKWNEFVEDFKTLKFTTISDIKKKLNISTQTAFNWRHKLLSTIVLESNTFSDEMIEFDESYFLISRKGRKNMGIENKNLYRKWRKNQVGGF
jgi:transposase-like protein